MTPPADTARLSFRALSLEDLDWLSAVLGDPVTMRFYPRVHSREETQAWIMRQLDRYRRDGHGLWRVDERASGKPIGQVGLVLQQIDGVAEPEIGYILDKSFWSRGYAHEAAKATRDHAFRALDKPRVISLVRPENVPSQRVALSIGMTIEKRAMHAHLEHLVFSCAR